MPYIFVVVTLVLLAFSFRSWSSSAAWAWAHSTSSMPRATACSTSASSGCGGARTSSSRCCSPSSACRCGCSTGQHNNHIRVRHLFHMLVCSVLPDTIYGCQPQSLIICFGFGVCWLQCSSGCKLRLPARCLLRLPARNCFVLGLLWLPARTCCGQANAGRAATPHAGDAPRVQLRELRRAARAGVGGVDCPPRSLGEPRRAQLHAFAPCRGRGGMRAGAGGARAVCFFAILFAHPKNQ